MPNQVLPALKVKARALHSQAMLKHKAAWAASFHSLLQRHRVKSTATKIKRAKNSERKQRDGAKSFIQAMDQQLQVIRYHIEQG